MEREERERTRVEDSRGGGRKELGGDCSFPRNVSTLAIDSTAAFYLLFSLFLMWSFLFCFILFYFISV